MKKEHRCTRCRKLLAIQRGDRIEILCTHRSSKTNGLKCGEINSIPLNVSCPSCKMVNKVV